MRQNPELLQYYRGPDFSVYNISSIIYGIWDDCEGEEYLLLLKKLEDQIRRLYRAVGRANKHFWPAFMKPWTHLEAKPLSFGLGDEAEMQIKLQ